MGKSRIHSATFRQSGRVIKRVLTPRFGLRTLVAGVTLIAVCLGCYRVFVSPYLRQGEIRRAIEEVGGSYHAQTAPVWLYTFFGADEVCVLTAVDIKKGSSSASAQSQSDSSQENQTDAMRERIIAQIPYLTEVQQLNVSGTDVTDADIARWGTLTKLESLDVSRTFVREPALWPRFPLTELNVSRTFLQDCHVGGLARYQSLTQLYLNSTPVTDVGLASLASLRELQELNVSYTGVTRDSLKLLQSLPELDVLNAWSQKPPVPPGCGMGLRSLSDEELIFLSNMPLFDIANGNSCGDGIELKPQALRLGNERERDATLREALAELGESDHYLLDKRRSWSPCLTRALHPENVAYKKDFVESMDLRYALIHGEELAQLAEFEKLRELSLRELFLPEDCYHHINACQGLESLDLAHSGITDKTLSQLGKILPRLHALNLNGTMITDEALSLLRDAKSLRKLSLARTMITDDGLRSLAELPHLEELVLPVERIHGPELDAPYR